MTTDGLSARAVAVELFRQVAIRKAAVTFTSAEIICAPCARAVMGAGFGANCVIGTIAVVAYPMRMAVCDVFADWFLRSRRGSFRNPSFFCPLVAFSHSH